MRKTVKPYSFDGWNMSLFQLFGSGPNFTITCGSCMATFKKRLSMVDNEGVVCPVCDDVNIMPLVVE